MTAEFLRKLSNIICEAESNQKLLAPNRTPSNLNPGQWHQVRTPQFKAWFGDWENSPSTSSNVVDENGEPLVVYHGTKSDFSKYDIKKFGASDEGLAGKGFYFTYNPTEASGYAENEQFGSGDAPNVQSVFLSVKNPLVITQGKLPDGRTLSDIHGGVGIGSKGGAIIRKMADDGGHDGVIWVSTTGMVGHVSAFQSTQIKSAIGNNGNYDHVNSDINEAEWSKK